MYARILVPVDGSAYSAEVIPYAKALAGAHGTHLVVVRIVDKASDHATAARDTEKLAAQFSAHSLCMVDSGDIADGILREAARVPDTLIAMTSHGRSGLAEVVLGSVALRLVRARRGPIVVYRPSGHTGNGSRPLQASRIVLPLDGTEASQAIAPQAAQLAAWIGVRLVVVSVIDAAATADMHASGVKVEESSYVRARANELAKQYGVEPGWEVLHGRPVDAIVNFAREDRGTILAMSTRGRTALRSALLGSVTSACLRHAGVPIFMRAP